MADADVQPPTARKSDLPVRAASAAVMLAVAGTAWALGGAWLDGFILIVALATYGEFARLVAKIDWSAGGRAAAWLLGAVYVAAGALALIQMSDRETVLLVVGTVICVDTFAYFFGRTLGGPKIAPRISPSKTWSGLIGGVVGATLALIVWTRFASVNANVAYRPLAEYAMLALPGAALAIAAQAGDFFESWLKRRAGVKDSSNLIPGHGGVFDRTDGLLPVAIVIGAGLWVLAPHWIAG